MFAIVYLAVAGALGWQLSGFLLRSKNRDGGSRIWLRLAAAFGVGTLVVTWALYFLAWMLHMLAGQKKPLILANIVVILLAAGLTGFFIWRGRKKGGEKEILIADKKTFVRECILYGILAAFVTFTMFYVFHVEGTRLLSGNTVFSDYAPHTAMIRSFSLSANFPTQYPHFGGEDVKYHFMFQCLVGNLEFLGLRIDIAYNIVSIFAMLGFLILLTQIARRLTGRFAAAVCASVLFFFRSGLALFLFLREHIAADDLFTTLKENVAFIGYTPNENWGLWNYNVYLNQRHLAFGLLIAALALYFFLDYIEANAASRARGLAWWKGSFVGKEAWLPEKPVLAALAGVVLGLSSFWNGATVIGGLLILAGFAIFSKHKLDYAIAAFATVVLSFLQTKIFIWGNAVSAHFQWGFIAEDKSMLGVLWFLLEVTGVTVFGAIVLAFFLDRKCRVALASFLLPVVFAFTMSLTPDVTVNQKYIMIACAFLTIFWGAALVKLFSRGWTKVVAVILAIALTATGVYEFTLIIRNNGEHHRIGADLSSKTLAWLAENTTEKDLLLTPRYSLSDVTLSGCMMYLGWPYYAWSAGYDTDYRGRLAVEMYTTGDTEELKELVRQEGIDYIIFEDGMDFDGIMAREDIIAICYQCVFTSDDGRIRIYNAK